MDRYLDDAIVLWSGYPGLDERDQFDFFTEAPELPQVVAVYHARGTRVVVPWGTEEWQVAAEAAGSEWYVEGGPREPSCSLSLPVPGAALACVSTVGFRCAVDLMETKEGAR